MASGPAGFLEAGSSAASNTLQLRRSTDGVTWEPVPPPTGMQFVQRLAAGPAGYVAVDDEVVQYSADGTSWEEVHRFASGAAAGVVEAAAGGAGFGIATASVPKQLVHSDDGRSWQELALPTAEMVQVAVSDDLIVGIPTQFGPPSPSDPLLPSEEVEEPPPPLDPADVPDDASLSSSATSSPRPGRQCRPRRHRRPRRRRRGRRCRQAPVRCSHSRSSRLACASIAHRRFPARLISIVGSSRLTARNLTRPSCSTGLMSSRRTCASSTCRTTTAITPATCTSSSPWPRRRRWSSTSSSPSAWRWRRSCRWSAWCGSVRTTSSTPAIAACA